jgi:hypothetical protein
VPAAEDDYDEDVTREFNEDRRLIWWGIALAASAALVPILALPAVVVAIVAIVRGHIGLGAVVIVGAVFAASTGLARNAEASASAIPAVPVNFHVGICPDDSLSTGCYYAHSNDLWIEDPTDRVTFSHEMGHAFDAQRLDDGERHRFSCLPAAQPPVEGDPDLCGARWDENVAEVFADAYANCRLRFRAGSVRFLYGNGYEPSTTRRHRNACRFIARAAD